MSKNVSISYKGKQVKRELVSKIILRILDCAIRETIGRDDKHKN